MKKKMKKRERECSGAAFMSGGHVADKPLFEEKGKKFKNDALRRPRPNKSLTIFG